MDNRQQELRVLGFFGILKESFKIIFSRKKIITQISLAFLIPITIIFQVKILTAGMFSFYMFNHRVITDFIVPQYLYFNSSYIASAKWVVYWFLSEIGYLILLLIFSLLSTIAIARTITCIYTAEDVNFKRVTAVIPKIWKRVLITFLIILEITFVYDYLLGPVLGLVLHFLLLKKFSIIKLVTGVILMILYIAMSMYITIILRLAAVVSVMEDEMSGTKAITKSRKLIKGKMVAAVAVFVVLLTFSAGVDAVFMLFVAANWFLTPGRIGVGIGSFILKLVVILLGFVLQTVIYFVCKSYHNENIEECVEDEEAMDVQLVKKPSSSE